MSKTFGQRFYELRKKQELTQERIAEKLNVSPQAVSKWENDQALPDVALLKSIAKLFDVTIDSLLGEDATTTEYRKVEEKDMSKMLLKIMIKSSNGDTVNVKVPVALVKVLAASGGDVLSSIGVKGGELNIEEILKLIDAGVVGNLVEIHSKNGDIINIFVDL